MESNQPGNFVCRFCKGTFSQAQYLFKHVREVHTASSSMKSSRSCPICGNIFGTGCKNEGYRTHLRHIHGLRSEGQTFAFKCFNDFFLWKTELEKRTSCKYALQSAPKVLPTNEKIHVYQCEQTPQTIKKRKLSSPNISNSKCPAIICATESMKNLEIKVDYWNTHVGHSVQVEQDELNAAINSVQDEPQIHVMDMLNSIGQGIETGAEVFVSESADEGMSSPSSSWGVQKNVSNTKKIKSVKATFPQSSPVIPNFSFKKDPSKKKESSIYSLASVACGKVSANKVNINKSASAQFQDLVKNIAKKNSGTIVIKNPKESFCKKQSESNKTSDSFNNEYPSNDFDTSLDSSKETNTVATKTHTEETAVTNIHSTTVGGRFVPINPMPLKKSLPDELNISNKVSLVGNSSGTVIGKSMSDKENVSLVSNKIDKSANKTPQSLLKTISKNSENSTISPKYGILGQNLKPLGIINPATPQIILAGVSVPPQNLSSSIETKKFQSAPSPISAITQSSNLTSQVASPMAQTYISIDNKLIPVVNTPGAANLTPGIILSSTLPQLSTSQIKPASLPNANPLYRTTVPGGLFPANKPLLAGSNEKGTSSLAMSFPRAPVVLIPYSNNSVIPSVLQSKPSVSVSSPVGLQTIRPTTSLPTKSIASSLISNSPANPSPTPVTKTVSVSVAKSGTSAVVTIEKPSLSNIKRSLLSTTTTNALKVQKVSLPISKSAHPALPNSNIPTDSKSILSKSNIANPVSSTPKVINKSTDSKTVVSNQTAVKTVLTNSVVTSTPSINISKIMESKTHKPGTFVFESSGELYMLEPLDDDFVIKNTTPLTSTPKKKSEISKTVTATTPKKNSPAPKRKYSPKGDSTIKSKKFKDDTGKEAVISVQETSTKSVDNICIEEVMSIDNFDSNSCTSDISDTSSSLKEKALACSEKPETSILTSPPEEKNKSIHSPFVNLFPVKCTDKTVSSFFIPQSKPSSSFVNSSRTSSSGLILTSSSPNCISSSRSAATSVEQTAFSSENIISDKACNSEPKETTEGNLEQTSDVKRGVTIKSVVQEKRCISDDDLEIMKKVKFYKLEMKYYSCQEECKKLKIQLAKALTKNKELEQIVEELKKNKNCTEDNDDIKHKSTTEEKIANCDEKIIHNAASVDDSSTDRTFKDDDEALEINPSPENNLLKHSDETKVVVPDTNDITSEKEMIDVLDKSHHGSLETTVSIPKTSLVPDTHEHSDSGKAEIVSIPDPNSVPNTDDISSEKDMIDVSDKSHDGGLATAASISNTTVVPDFDEHSDSGKAEILSILNTNLVPNTKLVPNTDDISFEKEMIDVSNESGDDDKAETELIPDTVEVSDMLENRNGGIATISDMNSVLNIDGNISGTEMMNVSDKSSDSGKAENTEEANISLPCFKENLLGANEVDVTSHGSETGSCNKECSEASHSEEVSKDSDNPKADVYTMVKTSVLRDLYLDIEDLCREKKKLLEDVEHYKKLLPSTE